MYNCHFCGSTSKPGVPLRTWLLTRPAKTHPGTEIAAELPVCSNCERQLSEGHLQYRQLEAAEPRSPVDQGVSVLRKVV
jgi:hypothetical protein